MTQAAIVAKEIRKILKANFPEVQFRVKSRNFSMGDAVDVYYTDGPTRDSVEALISQFSAGSFDSMEDMYVYNHNEGPTTKYLHVQRDMSLGMKIYLTAAESLKWGVNLADERETFGKLDLWPDQVLYRAFCEVAC